MRDEEGVVLPIPGDVAREAGLEERLDVVVSIRREPAEPLPDADGVRVYDESGEGRCIEEDRVCRLRTDPVEPEQLAPYRFEVPREEPIEVPARGSKKVSAESFQPSRLLAVEPRRPNESTDRPERGRRERARFEQTRSPEILDGSLHVSPGGLRHEEGPDDDLERRLRGPPVLRPESPGESVEHGTQFRHAGCNARSGKYLLRAHLPAPWV